MCVFMFVCMYVCLAAIYVCMMYIAAIYLKTYFLKPLFLCVLSQSALKDSDMFKKFREAADAASVA